MVFNERHRALPFERLQMQSEQSLDVVELETDVARWTERLGILKIRQASAKLSHLRIKE